MKIIDNPFVTELKDKHGDSWYHQIILEEKDKEIQRLQNIIKEAREYIQDRYNGEVLTHTFDKCNVGELLKILDKGE